MDSGILLIDAQSFQSYANRIAQQQPMKLAQMQQQIVAGALDDPWFAKIKAYEEGSEFDRRGSVAVINIRGFISYAYDFWTWWMDGCSYSGIVAKVRAAADDSNVNKIILNVNSPGGSTIGCLEAANEIFAARDKKEVVAVVNPEAASAGYWLASQAERIVAMQSGWVGSVGAQSDYQSWAGMLKEAGIDWKVIRSEVSPDKNLGHRMEPISERATDYIQGLVDYVASDFIAHVARGRGLKTAEVVSKFGHGRMLFSPQAMESGMIDSIGDLNSELIVESAKGSSSNSRSYQTRAAADSTLRI